MESERESSFAVGRNKNAGFFRNGASLVRVNEVKEFCGGIGKFAGSNKVYVLGERVGSISKGFLGSA